MNKERTDVDKFQVSQANSEIIENNWEIIKFSSDLFS